jgi:hypothetical protein
MKVMKALVAVALVTVAIMLAGCSSSDGGSRNSNCAPGYSPCIKNVDYDLDCADIGQEVSVTGEDQYRLDADGDGYGCETYG